VIHPYGRRKWAQSTRRMIEGSIAWMRMWKGCRKQGGRLGKGARKEVCSLTVASRNVQKGGSAAHKCKCQRALTEKQTLTSRFERGQPTRAIAAWSYPLGPRREQLLLWDRCRCVADCEHAGVQAGGEECQHSVNGH
jgi:hypothetical protein